MRAEPSGDKQDLILQEIWDSRVIMEQKLGAITTDLNLLKDEQHKLADRVKSTEPALATLLPAQTDHDSMLIQLRKQVEQLQDRAEECRRKTREWLYQNFQGTRSDQQHEFASQKSNRQARRTRRKQNSVNNARECPSPRLAQENQLEAIQLATTLRDPSRRSSTESSLAGDSDTGTEDSVALFPTIMPQTTNEL
ncbi:hypothetical protein NDU88_007105 [Pleurodeles waltl]|uniref:Uncharacterized protein n=1 Tax=Pleurodeles waltl TaxID=8319 RepID=A0AAV7RU07_PLEWA|nr:hypothetical protein NDU88_007105 [Pleurodeles waltl]